MVLNALIKEGMLPLFSHWITPEERTTVKKGLIQFYKFKETAKDLKDRLSKDTLEQLERIVGENEVYLSYIGDPRYDWRLEAWIPFWRKRGLDRVADALQVRLDEARHEDEEPPATRRDGPRIKKEPEEPKEESGEESENYSMFEDVEDEEEAPPTLRSLVSKTLQYATLFVKVARG